MKSKNSKDQLQHAIIGLYKMRVILFIALVLLAYSFVVFRIYTLGKVQPSQSSISSESSASSNPKIDPATIAKIKQLQNNSVGAQALFNQARQNPFQE